jgi:hypothetical protein
MIPILKAVRGYLNMILLSLELIQFNSQYDCEGRKQVWIGGMEEKNSILLI